jgi:hypothetical protein
MSSPAIQRVTDDTFDPLAFRDSAIPELERKGAAGLSHVLFTKSPEGVLASVRRTIGWRRQIENAAARYRLEADLVEAIVLLESAGRPLLHLSKRLRKLRMALSDPARTAALVVTLPEPMVAAETMRLLNRLSSAAVPVTAVICNRFDPGRADPYCGAGTTLLAPELDRPPAGRAARRGVGESWRAAPVPAPS